MSALSCATFSILGSLCLFWTSPVNQYSLAAEESCYLMSSMPTTSWPAQNSATTHSRPWTGQTRPTTARPQTTASTVRREGSYVIAILEGRGVSREVGIAALDRDTGHVMLVQVCRFRSITVCSTKNHRGRLLIVKHTSSLYIKCISMYHILSWYLKHFCLPLMQPWPQQENGHHLHHCLCNTYLRSFLVSKSNPLADDTGMTLLVS